MPFEPRWERARGVPCLLLLLSVWPLAVTAQTAHSIGVISTLGSGFNGPEGIAVDTSGDVFVADTNNSAVKEIVAVNGVVSPGSSVIVVGSGFNAPFGVAVDSSGDVFVADTNNNQVKEIVAVNGKVSSSSQVITIASGAFSFPFSVAFDSSGDLFVADATNGGAVKEAVAVNGVVSSGSQVITISTSFSNPGGVSVDGSGDVFVADFGNSEVKEIVAVNGKVSSSSNIVVVGHGFNHPFGVAVDGSGNVFVADTDNSALKEIVAVNGAVSSTSTVASIGGGLDYPYSVALDGKGDLFVGDTSNNAVKEITQKFPATAVGSASSAETVYFSFDSGGSLAATPYIVFTDFQAAATQPANACVGGQSYSTGSICAVNVTFAPTKPYVRTGAVQLIGSAGAPIATDYLRGNGTGPQVTFLSNAVAPQVGSGFTAPYGIAVDGSGDVFVADTVLSAVYEVVAVNGRVSSSSSVVPVGSGFANPHGVAVDGSGNVFVADYTHGAVKKIVAVNGAVSSSSSVITVGSGFSAPTGVAVDGSGTVFVADSGNSAVKEIVAVNGVVTASSAVNTVGSGFGSPAGVAVDGSGNVFVADNGNSAVYQIVAVNGVVTSKSVVNPVGSGFSSPAGVAVDGGRNLFVADTLNNEVKEIVATSSWVVPLSSGFFHPRSVAIDSYGNVFVADSANSAAKEIDRSDPPSLTFANTIVGSTSSDSPQSVLFQNSGNQTLFSVSPGLAIGTNFVQAAGGGNPPDCTASFSLSPGQECNLSISFIPTTAGPIVSTAMFTDNALNASPSVTQAMQLNGTGQPATPTSTVVTAAPSLAVPGVSVQLSATVSSAAGVPPGWVTFTYGSTTLGPVALSNGSAEVTTTALPLGSDTVTASYLGGSSSSYTFAASSGSTVVDVVTAPTLALVSLSPSSGDAAAQAFTAVYSDSSGASDISYASILLNTSNIAANGCYVNYYPATNALYLGNNTGVLTGPITPGSSATLSNSQCTLLGTGTSATSSGNSISITFNLTFSSSFSGSDNIYAAMSSMTAGVSSVSQQLGTWNAGVQLPTTPVGSTSAPTTVYFTFSAAVTLSSPPYVVLTQGGLNLDFQAAATQPSNACVGGQSYSAGSVCAVNVTFTPTRPYQRTGVVQLLSSGAVAGTVYLNGTGTGPQALFPGNAPTYAVGSGFYGPQGVAVDGNGDVFVADVGQIPNAPSGTYASRVLEIVANNGVVTSTSATLQLTVTVNMNPVTSVAVDGSGNLFVCNSSGTVNEFQAVNGVINVLSSVPISGFSFAQAVAVDGNGNLFVADEGGAAVYEVMAVNGAVSSNSPKFKIGSGFSAPYGVAVDRFGNVFVSDFDTNGVYEIVAVNGVVSSSSRVIPVGSGFSYPTGVSVDGSGNVFVSDRNHNQVKEIVAVNGTVSSTSTVIPVGGGFNSPLGVAVDATGNIFVADNGHAAVKETDRKDPPALTFASTPLGSTSSDSPQSVLLQNIGNQTLSAVSPGLAMGASFVQVAGSGNPPDCTSAFALAAGQECNLSISFQPQTVGPVQSSATFTGNALNAQAATQMVSLSGTGQPLPVTTQIAVTAAPVYTYLGAPVQLSATVSPATGGPQVTPSGSVTFSNNTTTLGTATLSNTGVATFSTSALPLGSDTITASYAAVVAGNYSFSAASGTVAVTITSTAPTLTLGSVSPAGGTGPAEAFTAVYTDSYGVSDLSSVGLLLNASNSAISGCSVSYSPAKNGLYLANNAGTLTGPITPGSAAQLSNSQCVLQGSGSSAVQSGNTLTVTFNIGFTGNFVGAQQIYTSAASLTGITAASPQMGSWFPNAQFPATAVGSTSAPLTISFTIPQAGQLFVVSGTNTPYVIMGLTDFQAAATQQANACVGGHTYNAGDICTVNVTFTPARPYQRVGAVQLFLTSNSIVTVHLAGTGTGPQVIYPANPPNNAVFDTGSSNGSDFYPVGMAVDSSGDVIYTAHNPESGSASLYEVVATNGVISVNSPSTQLYSAQYSWAGGVALDGAGNVFFAMGPNVFEYQPLLGTVTQVGSGFIRPGGLAVDGRGDVFVADNRSGAGAVYEIVAVKGAVSSTSTVIPIGSGFSEPYGLALDSSGDVFVTDLAANQGIFEIVAVNGVVSASSTVVKVGGTDYPQGGVALDGAGNVFYAASAGSLSEIVAVNGTVSSTSTVVPVGAGFNASALMAIDGAGNLFGAGVTTSGNNQIYSINRIDRSDPPALTFNPTAIGSSSSDSPKSVVFQNSGNANLTAVSPGLSIGSNFVQVAGSGNPPDCTATFALAAGQECNLSISFTPTTASSSQTTATLTDNAGTQVVTLSGIVTPVISPTSLQFGSINTGAVSAAQTVTVSNTGSLALSITGIALGGVNPTDFAETTTCGTTLLSNANCTVSVTFAPLATGSLSAMLSVTTKAGSTSSTQTIALSGVGVATGPVAGLTPASLTFASEPIGTASAAQTLTLSNTGTAALTIAGIAIGSADPGDFSQSNTCGSSLAVAGSCTISVKFDPAATGTRTASVIVTDNSYSVTGSTQTSALSGTGTASVNPAVVSVSPASGTGLAQTFIGVYSDPERH